MTATQCRHGKSNNQPLDDGQRRQRSVSETFPWTRGSIPINKQVEGEEASMKAEREQSFLNRDTSYRLTPTRMESTGLSSKKKLESTNF
jgi:hypothetical protein